MKLLILDDHPSIHVVFKALLKELDYQGEILCYTELGDTLEAIVREQPNFVVTDIQIDHRKQLEVMSLCAGKKIPYMVYTSHVNLYIIEYGRSHSMSCFVAKTAPIPDLMAGLKALMSHHTYICSMTSRFLESQKGDEGRIPEVQFTGAEEDVILGQLAGKSSIEISRETHKSKYTIRNQRMSLMEKNQCSMEEVVRRYLYWHTNG